jgi:serine/threonine-protein kinase RsbW
VFKKLDENTIEISLPTQIGYERIAMDCSASFAKIVGFVKERIEDLKTAVSEACLNAMEHGNKGHIEARVVVTLNFKDDTLSISIKDEGKGIPELPQEPDIEKKVYNLEPPKGFGIYLIKELMDQVEFNQIMQDGHIVRMIMKLTP